MTKAKRVHSTPQTDSSPAAGRAKWAVVKLGIRQRIRLIANERNLSNDQIAKAITCKDDDLLQFADDHNLSLDWLICGDLQGRLRMARGRTERHRLRSGCGHERD
jgi:hypothetical protein